MGQDDTVIMKIRNESSEHDKECDQPLDLTFYKAEEQVFQRLCLCRYLSELEEVPEGGGTAGKPLAKNGERRDDRTET